jgi:hypothetical protein
MIMTTVIIRQKLVEYMKIADDKKVKAIFSSKKAYTHCSHLL